MRRGCKHWARRPHACAQRVPGSFIHLLLHAFACQTVSRCAGQIFSGESQSVRSVLSAEQLRTAVNAGAEWIIVREHLDLSGYSSGLKLEDHSTRPLQVRSSTVGIKGACSNPIALTPPGDSPNMGMEHQQCLIVHDFTLFAIDSGAGGPVRVWISGFYLRAWHSDFTQWSHSSSSRQAGPIWIGAVDVRGAASSVYIEDVIIQGDSVVDGRTAACFGLEVADLSRMHCERCTVADMTDAYGPVAHISQASASFHKCYFISINATEPGAEDTPRGGYHVDTAAILMAGDSCALRVADSKFLDVYPAGIGTEDGNGTAFVDSAAAEQASDNVSTAPPWNTPGGGSFLSVDDTWLQSVKAAVPETDFRTRSWELMRHQPVLFFSAAGAGGLLIVASVVAVVVCVCCKRKKGRRSAVPTLSPISSAAHTPRRYQSSGASIMYTNPSSVLSPTSRSGTRKSFSQVPLTGGMHAYSGHAYSGHAYSGHSGV